jgi:ApaG protein
MYSAVSNGIEISVKVKYRNELSDPSSSFYFFNYEITITNHTSSDVQLLQRYWNIIDLLNDSTVVSGEGVVGLKPILQPNEHFTYESGCKLFSEFGYMKGYYTFQNMLTQEQFRVQIPTFHLELPSKLN